jgi:hypothetical protein
LPQQTRWADFLQAFYTAGASGSKQSKVSSTVVNTHEVSTVDPLTLHAEVEGDNTAFVYSFIGVSDPDDPATLQLQTLDFLYPPGATLNGEPPSWPMGRSDVRLRWAATSWYVSNGQDVVQVPFSPTSYGSNIYSVDGFYTAPSGDEIDASLEFEVIRGHGRLLHIWGFDEGGDGEPQLYELDPSAGASFTSYVDTYTTVGDEVEEGVTEGEPIVFGATPLVASEGPAPQGDYIVGLLVENVAGDISEDYVEITVTDETEAVAPDDFVPPGLEQGTQSGTLVYSDPDLGIRFDYPQGWEIADAGSDKIVLYEPAATIATYLSVDVASYEESPEIANQAMLEELLALAENEEGFEQESEIAETHFAGLDASTFAYRYTGEYEEIAVTAVAVTDPENGRTYLITMEMPHGEASLKHPIFDQLLATLQMVEE